MQFLRFFCPLCLIAFNCATADAQTVFGCAGRAIIGSFNTSSGDGGQAANAQLFNPGQMAVDAHGNVYIVDLSNEKVRKVSPAGIISTVAGNGIAASTGDGGPAAQASLHSPGGVAVDGAGNIYISESNGGRIRKISAAGTISTFAGNGHAGFSGDGAAASNAMFNSPRGLAIDPQGNLFVADYWNLRVRRIAPDGTITTVVGRSGCCTGTPIDGSPGTSINYGGDSLAIATNGNLLISTDGVVAYLDSSGILHDVTSEAYPGTPPAEGANARQAAMSAGSIAAAADGSIYVLSYGTIWQIQPNGLLHDVGSYGNHVGNLSAVAALSSGMVLGAAANSVYSFSKSGQRTVFAGVETFGFSGDGQPAAAALLSWIGGVAVDKAGNIYLSDPNNNRVRRVTTDGLMSTFAGTGGEQSGGDGGPANAAQIDFPQALAFDPLGNLYIAEEEGGAAIGDNQVSAFVRKIAPDGTITRFAGGNGPFSPLCFFGCIPQSGKAMDADLGVMDIASDSKGQIYLLDQRAMDIWKIDLEGNISYFASQLPIQRGGDYGQIRFDPSGNLYWLTPELGVTTGLYLIPPSQQPASVSTWTYPQSFAFDAKDNLYYSGLTGEIYRQTPAGDVSTIFYNVSPETTTSIYPVTTDSSGNLYFADQARNRLFEIPNAASCEGPQPPLTNSVFNAASYSQGVAPGELVTFFGFSLGPTPGVGPSIVGGNRFDTQAGGVRVLFDGVPAPVLYASAGQVSAVVPFGVAGAATTTIQIEANGLASDPMNIQVIAAIPGIFTRDSSGQGQAAAQNQDSTPNGPSNPAPTGSTIVIFATGAGVTTPASVDGVIAGASPPKPVLPVTATVGGQPAQVAYAGGAPLEVNGILQVNIVIPAGTPSGATVPLVIQVGTAPSQSGVTIAVQ